MKEDVKNATTLTLITVLAWFFIELGEPLKQDLIPYTLSIASLYVWINYFQALFRGEREDVIESKKPNKE